MSRPEALQSPREFETVAVGDRIEPVVYGPLTVMHLVRWCAAMENWHRIHYDHQFCQEHEGLPGPLVNGSWKQQVLAQLLKEWAGPSGWLLALTYQFRGMDTLGATLTARGTVVGVEAHDEWGDVRCQVELVNAASEATTVGEAVIRLHRRGASPVSVPVAPESSLGFSETSTEIGVTCPPQFRECLGLRSATLVSPDVVDASSLRRFMQSIMARDPDYYDEGVASAGRFGGIVAPPLYPLYALRVPADADDPLTRASRDPDFDGASQTPWSSFGLPELAGAPQRLLNAGNGIDLFSYAPTGTRIAVESVYQDIEEKPGKRGPLLFVSVLSRFTVHETGDLLLQSRQTTILR
ncbi:FAS1-like dehydratase domain-containing protein [Nocardioides sp.]|uniref:MaoC family dehydratase n=1 Tax=Nocardioides sp. TaxID=35761 RepID=UPI003D0C7448